MPRSPLFPPALVALTLTVAPGALGRCDGDAAGPAPHALVQASGPDVATRWSELALDIAYAEDEFLTFKGHRTVAMMHLAMHDALQAIVPEYQAYAYDATEPDADPVAAIAAAAYHVLLNAYPDRQATLDAELGPWLARSTNAGARNRGEQLGAASAAAIIALREGDGWDEPGTYTFTEGPGRYRTTPPWEGFTLQPGFRHARPFSFDDPSMFRPPPPPRLDSQAYADALEEVRAYGDSLSAVRTADQTGYAVWWMEFAEASVGRLVRDMLANGDANLWEANRMLAHLYVALFDGYVSNWDSKYEYDHWRPYTAIRAAAEDGNPATSPDPTWRPLRPTPPFPEYASAHATGCAAAFEVAARFFGDAVTFELTTRTAPPGMPTRTFTSLRAAADECGDSRVRLGWHYRYAVDAGLTAGRSIAGHVVDTLLRPR